MKKDINDNTNEFEFTLKYPDGRELKGIQYAKTKQELYIDLFVHFDLSTKKGTKLTITSIN